MKIRIRSCTLSYSMAMRISGKTIVENKFFFIFFSTVIYLRILNIVPLLYSRTLLFIHSVYNSLSNPLLVNHKSFSYLFHRYCSISR